MQALMLKSNAGTISIRRLPTWKMLISLFLLSVSLLPMGRAQRNVKTGRNARSRRYGPAHVVDFFDEYTLLGLEEMYYHEIPASVTIAQAILETGWGRSELAKKGHNFFGIKFKGWEESKIWYKNDYYRKYQNVGKSFSDHSKFLLGKDEIQKLIDAGNKNYKDWTRTLIEIKYAEDPGYANKLNDLIQRYDLNELDSIPKSEIKFIIKRG